MPLNAHEFLKIVKHPVIDKYKPKIVVGGPVHGNLNVPIVWTSLRSTI